MRGISPTQFREYVIVPTLRELGEYSRGTEELLFATVAHESLGGRLLHQQHGRALSPYQIEPATHDDIWRHYLAYKRDLSDKVRAMAVKADSEELITNLKYATAMAYLVYRRAPGSIPHDPTDMDEIWRYYKTYYNTYKGAATKSRFLQDYKLWI